MTYKVSFKIQQDVSYDIEANSPEAAEAEALNLLDEWYEELTGSVPYGETGDFEIVETDVFEVEDL